MIILVIFNLMLLSLGSLNQSVLALQIQSLLRICNGTSSLRIYFCMNVDAIMKNAELEKLFEIDEVLAETPEWFKRLLSSGGQARKEIGCEPELPHGQVHCYDRQPRGGRGEVASIRDSLAPTWLPKRRELLTPHLIPFPFLPLLLPQRCGLWQYLDYLIVGNYG